MYTDLLTRIKNAQQAEKKSLKIPFSKMDLAVAQVLVQYGFISDAQKKGRMPKRVIEIELNYDTEGKGAITNTKFVSVPSRRFYVGYREMFPVKQGYGLGVVSTSKGIMSTEDARKQKIGGQLLFEIW